MCPRRLWVLAILGIAGAAGAATIADPGQGPVEISVGETGAVELSGLTHARGNRYYAVSDKGGRVYPVEISIDSATGFVREARLGAAVTLKGGRDLEGVAWVGSDRIYVASEVGPTIREHDLATGAQVGSIAIPPIYRRARWNKSLESLARRSDGTALWTANEEALVPDGPLSSETAGTTVRLQRFDAAGAPDGQWAYRTDPWNGKPLFGVKASGVVDLLALPDGKLLALERSVGSRGLRVRIYQVDFEGATDTSGLASLASQSHTPVSKQLLWETGGLTENFEGMTLGPALDGGATSLLLIADDAGTGQTRLHPLRLHLDAKSPDRQEIR